MLKHKLLHPEILYAIAGAGHGSKILITDGNYPASTKEGVCAETIYLNLAPGIVKVTEVLDTLLTAVEIEEAHVMSPATEEEPDIYKEFRQSLPHLSLVKLGRFEFYEQASSSDTCIQIVTGDQRLYANILLTIGVVKP